MNSKNYMLADYEKFIEQLLRAQHSISECISHKPTRGATREDFFKEQIRNVLPKYRVASGVIIDQDGHQSPQCDCILIDSKTTCRRLGNQEIVYVEDVLALIEVKSTIRGVDLKKFNDDLKKIAKFKPYNSNIRKILLGFNVDLQMDTFYKRFGYKFFPEIESFKRDLNQKYIRGKRVKKDTNVDYSEIDAVVNLSVNTEGEDSFFIQRIPDVYDANNYYINKCEGDEYAFGQFLNMLK